MIKSITSLCSNTINGMRKDSEKSAYYSRVFAINDMTKSEVGSFYKRARKYARYNGCHIFFFKSQEDMIGDGIVKFDDWRGRYEISEMFEHWAEDNLRGFYDIRGWGNGRANKGQVGDGIWHVQLRCMRDEDAMVIRLAWLNE